MSAMCDEGETITRWCRAPVCRQAAARAYGCSVEQLPGWNPALEQHERNMAELGHGPLGDRYSLGPPAAEEQILVEGPVPVQDAASETCEESTPQRRVMGTHIVDGEFQSDKYPGCPRGKVPLSVQDPSAQDLLWEYAQRRRAVDTEFSGDLETALIAAGYEPPYSVPLVVLGEVPVSGAAAARSEQPALAEQPVHAVTFRELAQQISQHAKDHPDDDSLDHGVVVRLQTNEADGDDLHVGGLRSISIECGCTDTFRLVLDADQEPDDDLDELDDETTEPEEDRT